MTKLLKTILPILIACTAGVASADVALPAIFSDNMVLQRDMDVPVWGTAEAGEKVTVTFRDQTATATADDNGFWRVDLKPLSLGDPGTLTVSGNNEIQFEDVLVGEVWVASGQSNMQWAVTQAEDPDIEIAAANEPNIRLFYVPRYTAREPNDDITPEGQEQPQWTKATPETVAPFSAVAWHFGRNLNDVLDVPIGLINTSWGGTRAEAWTTPDAMASTSELSPILEAWQQRTDAYDPEKAQAQYEKALADWEAKRKESEGKKGVRLPRRPSAPANPRDDRHHPSNLYNAMVAPLVPFAIRGAIWYQGESNAGRAYQYRTLMPTLIESWRDVWNQGDFPFYLVQLANYREIQPDPVESDWAELREAQTMTIEKLPNVGMAVITDLGAAKDIHPKDKQGVGRRLARLALNNHYGKDQIIPTGPRYKSMDIQGDKIIVHFDGLGVSPYRGLISWYREPLTGFAIAGEDRQWKWANARIVGDTVEVSHPDVPDPVAVRYNWADNPQGNLYNAVLLPAWPFRSDDWPGITVNNVTP